MTLVDHAQPSSSDEPEPAPPAVVPPLDDISPEEVPSPEEIAEELAEVDEALDERRYPSTIGGAFYLVLLAVAGVGLGVVWGGDWRLGIRLLAASLATASLLRLVLPARDAGMLRVRHRLTDCLVMGSVAAALFFLATTIPDQPS